MFVLAAVCVLAACGTRPAPNVAGDVGRLHPREVEAPPEDAPSASTTRGWDEEVLAAIKGYREWERVADYPKWAPTLCTRPAPTIPIHSDADAGPHSRKLYFLYVKDHAAYSSPGNIQPVGQVLVKEGYVPEEAGTDDDGAKQFRCGKRTDLFIMMRTNKEEGTDAGWIYAIVTPDGKRVDHAGRLESCMRCHQDVGPSRMFGVTSGVAGETRKPMVVSGPVD
jgi:hypothetical protein